MNKLIFCTQIHDENQMLEFGAALASACSSPAVIFLYGQLGVGKTTLTRGFLLGLGHQGNVKSPTYTLVEPYDINGQQIYHFDLYRLNDPHELEYIGIQDYFHDTAICIVEWPERGDPLLPRADLSCYIEANADGRILRLEAGSDRGQHILNQLTNNNHEKDG